VYTCINGIQVPQCKGQILVEIVTYRPRGTVASAMPKRAEPIELQFGMVSGDGELCIRWAYISVPPGKYG